MMPSDLSPSTRALLDAAREGLAPDAAMLNRVRGKIDAAVAGGAGVTSGISLGAKLSILSVLALTIGGALLLRGGADNAASPALDLQTPAFAEAATQRTHEAAPPAARIEKAPLDAPPPQGVRVERPLAPVEIDLAREVVLVDAAMGSLRAGDAMAAIQSVRLHRAETNDHGQLAEDAAAIEVEALCKLHDRRVIAKLEAFDARWPDSAQRSRLSTTCF